MAAPGKAAAIFTGSATLEDEAKVLADYVVGQRLGEGAYGSVYVAKYIPSGEPFALKILQKQDLFQTYAETAGTGAADVGAGAASPLGYSLGVGLATSAAPASAPLSEKSADAAVNDVVPPTTDLVHSPLNEPPVKVPFADNPFDRLVVQEAAVMQSLEHPHVVKLYKFLNSTVAFYFIMELAEGGELFDLIISKQHFSEDEARHYFQQLISAIDYCHRNGVAHKDLKAENLLLAKDGRLLVCDFGFSSRAVNRNVDDLEEAGTAVESGTTGEPVTVEGLGGNHTVFGTLHYMSPEAVQASTRTCLMGDGFDLRDNGRSYGGQDEEDSEYSSSEAGALSPLGDRQDRERSEDDDYCSFTSYANSRPTSFFSGGDSIMSLYARLREAARQAAESGFASPNGSLTPQTHSITTGAAGAWRRDEDSTLAVPNTNTSFASAAGKEGRASVHHNGSKEPSAPPVTTSPTATTPALSSRPSTAELDAQLVIAGKAVSDGSAVKTSASHVDVAMPALTSPSQGVRRVSPTAANAHSMYEQRLKAPPGFPSSPTESSPAERPAAATALPLCVPGEAERTAQDAASVQGEGERTSSPVRVLPTRGMAMSASTGALDCIGSAAPSKLPRPAVGQGESQGAASGAVPATGINPPPLAGSGTATAASLRSKVSGQLQMWMKSIKGEKASTGERGMRHSATLGSLSEVSTTGGHDRGSARHDEGHESDYGIAKKAKKKEKRDKEKKKEKRSPGAAGVVHCSASEAGEDWASDVAGSPSPTLDSRGVSSMHQELEHPLRGTARTAAGEPGNGRQSSSPSLHRAKDDAAAAADGKKAKRGKASPLPDARPPHPRRHARMEHDTKREAEARLAREKAENERRRLRRKRRKRPAVVDPYLQDLWSAGVILFFMLTGRLPFDGRDEEETQHLIEKGELSWSEEEERRLSAEARKLVRSMLAHDPTDRPALEDIIATRWFTRRLNVAAVFPHREEELTLKLMRAGLLSPLVRITTGSRLGAKLPSTGARRGDSAVEGGNGSGVLVTGEDPPSLSNASSFLDFSDLTRDVTEREEQVLATAFHKIDTDGYGKITRDELRDMMTTLHGDVVEQKSVSELVNLFTGDANSKEITFKQFRDAWVNKDLASIPFTHNSEFQLANIIGTQMDDVERVVVRQLREAFDSVDVHHVGVIDLDELRAVFEKCHIPVQEEDLRSLMKFFHEKDLMRKNTSSHPGGTRLRTSPVNANLGSGQNSTSNLIGAGATANASFESAGSRRCDSRVNDSPSLPPSSPVPHAMPPALAPSAHSPEHTCISFDGFVMGIVHREILLRHPLGRKLAAATNLTALFHARNVTECVRHGFLVAGLQNVVLEKLSSVPERLLLLYSDEVVSNTENIYSFRYLGSSAPVNGATMEVAAGQVPASASVASTLAPMGSSVHSLLMAGSGPLSCFPQVGSSQSLHHTPPRDDGADDFGDHPTPATGEHAHLATSPNASHSMRCRSVAALPVLQDRHMRARRLLSCGGSTSHAGSLTKRAAPIGADSVALQPGAASPPSPSHRSAPHPPPMPNGPPRPPRPAAAAAAEGSAAPPAVPRKVGAAGLVLAASDSLAMSSSVPVPLPSALLQAHQASAAGSAAAKSGGAGGARGRAHSAALIASTSSIDSNDGESQYSSNRCSSSVMDSVTSQPPTAVSTPSERVAPPFRPSTSPCHHAHTHHHHHHRGPHTPHAHPHAAAEGHAGTAHTSPSSPKAAQGSTPSGTPLPLPTQRRREQSGGSKKTTPTSSATAAASRTSKTSGGGDAAPTNAAATSSASKASSELGVDGPSSVAIPDRVGSSSTGTTAVTAAFIPSSVPFMAASNHGNVMATSTTHRVLAFGGSGVVPQVNGVCDVDVILAPAFLGYTLMRFRRIHGKTSDFHEAVTFISNLLDFERQQAVEDTMPCGESELM